MPFVATCGPNEVLVVSGCFKSRPQFIHGGRAFICPGLQKVERISVNTMTLNPHVKDKKTSDSIPIEVAVVIQARVVSMNEEILNMAVENFLSKSEDEIKRQLLASSEALLITTISNFKAADIKDDFKKFSKALFEVISEELIFVGIGIISVTVNYVKDDNDYFKNLALEKIAEAVKKDKEAGKTDSFVSKFDRKLKEFDENKKKEEGSSENKKKEVEDTKEGVKSEDVIISSPDRVEQTYEFKTLTTREELYKGYDWGAQSNKDKKALMK
ncbi:hypothetical protein LOTGIDRAFT_172453 [Lottia gigantea]|uniref:Band 7 domain-containing protein n=1 Tax=Lottia gigantea TaxID=225164 RepID=V4CHT3_LOTGI|nr:hypothetical protein LOTGIDRAFT_172453 [Lottia gigantea]ESP01700.1 hypothetical protein LOTGIDRAFT_172453 [Lottia gigantea]